LSFYAFFANKNDDPELLMEAATWWISIHKLDHFEKAKKNQSNGIGHRQIKKHYLLLLTPIKLSQ
jgi:hypothetical protein